MFEQLYISSKKKPEYSLFDTKLEYYSIQFISNEIDIHYNSHCTLATNAAIIIMNKGKLK